MIEKPVIIITGAANGIGRSTALKFAANGYALALVDNDSVNLNSLKKELEDKEGELLCIDGDLQDLDIISGIIDKTVHKWGRIDVLVNNAAWRTIETMRSISIENWEKTLRICLTAPAFLAKHAAAIMEEKNIAGAIINISSVMSQRAGGSSPAYIACKGGIDSLTYELAVLYGPRGIRVNAVRPGNIETNISSDFTDEEGHNISERLVEHLNDHTPLQRSGRPEEIANVIYWLSTEDASFITGASILADGGILHNFNAYDIKKLQFPDEF